MNRYQAMVDMYFTEDGDFVLDENIGDFRDTSLEEYRALIQKVYTVVASNKKDWLLQPNQAANLAEFQGQPNTRELGEAIKNRLYSVLIKDGLLAARDLQIFTFPRSQNSIAVILSISPPGTQTQIRLPFVYSMKDNMIVPRNL